MIVTNFLTKNFLITFCDAPEAWQINIQDPATPIVEGMIFFHNYLMFFIIAIGVFVCWMLYVVLKAFEESFENVLSIHSDRVLQAVERE